MNRYNRKAYEKAAADAIREGLKVAAENAAGMLQTFNTATLVAAARGTVDLNALAVETLASRGLNPETGEWVGFKEARKLADLVRDDRCLNTTPKA